jgi:hypothetical protein
MVAAGEVVVEKGIGAVQIAYSPQIALAWKGTIATPNPNSSSLHGFEIKPTGSVA